MTSIAPIAGVAPLSATMPAPEPVSLHAVLGGGANLGGQASADWSVPSVPGVGTAVAGASGAAATAAAPPAASAPGATGGGGAQAQQGAAAIDQGQLVAALQQVVAAVNQLITALQAQGGVTGGGGTTAGGGGGVGQCGMPGCTMDHGARQAAQGAAGAREDPAPLRDARSGADE